MNFLSLFAIFRLPWDVTWSRFQWRYNFFNVFLFLPHRFFPHSLLLHVLSLSNSFSVSRPVSRLVLPRITSILPWKSTAQHSSDDYGREKMRTEKMMMRMEIGNDFGCIKKGSRITRHFNLSQSFRWKKKSIQSLCNSSIAMLLWNKSLASV